MPYTKIKGDVPQNVIRLPRLGKIRLGVKMVSKKTGNEYPKETSYFVCPDEVKVKFGPEPTRLPVMLPVEDESQMCRQYYAVYGSNQRLKCQGDGETYERRMADGTKSTGACPAPATCEYALANGKDGKPGCRARIDLMVVLPDVSVGGVYQLSTGSVNSDIDIRSGIVMAKSLYGRASWVPMELVREERKMLEPGTAKMQTHYPVRLVPIGNLETVMAVRKDPMLIPTGETARYLLPEPQIEGPEPDTPVLREQDEPEEAVGATPTDPEAGLDPIAIQQRDAFAADLSAELDTLTTEAELKAWGLRCNELISSMLTDEQQTALREKYRQRRAAIAGKTGKVGASK